MLIAHTPDLHTIAAPLSMMGLRIGTRMTVLRLRGGETFVHSPVPISDALAEAVTAIGPVAWIVCPSAYHHLHAGAWIARFPDAALVGPRSLAKKRPDLSFATHLEDAPGAWSSDLTPLHIDGTMLDETVFVHAASHTVISSDLTENFVSGSSHGPTNLYLKVAGIHRRPGWSRLLRFLYRDKRAARRSIDALLEHDFDRVILAHGDVLEADAKDAVRETFHFLD